jgi:hypothetical protein
MIVTKMFLVLLVGVSAQAAVQVSKVDATQESNLRQVGQSQGLSEKLQYKRINTMAEQYSSKGVKNLIATEPADLVADAISGNLPQFREKFEYTPIVSGDNSKYTLIKGFDITGGKSNRRLVVLGRYVFHVKKDLETVKKAFIPLEIKGASLPPDWLEARKTKADFVDASGNYRIVNFKSLKGGHFESLCTSASHVVDWTPDHTEVQNVDVNCIETDNAKSLASAEALANSLIKKGKAFTWTEEGRQSIDLIRVSANVTAIVVRNITHLYTHDAGWGLVKVDLKKVLGVAKETAGKGIIAHIQKMGIRSVKSSDF